MKALERKNRELRQANEILRKAIKTTFSDKAQPSPLDRINAQLRAGRPNELWVSDFTYVSTW